MGQGSYYIKNFDYQYLAQNSDTLQTADTLPAKQVSLVSEETDTVKNSVRDTALSAKKALLRKAPITLQEKQLTGTAQVPRENYVPEMPDALPSGALKDWMSLTGGYDNLSSLKVFSSVGTVQPAIKKEIPRNEMLPDWFFLLFLAGLLVLSSARMLYERYFNRVLISLTNEYQALSLYKSRNLFTSQVIFMLLLNFILITPLAIFLLMNGEGGEYTGRLVTVLGIAASIAGIVVLRRIVLYVTGELFQSNKVFGEYSFFIRNFYIKIGLVLLPFVLLAAYSRGISPRIFLVTAAVLVGILYLERLYRGFRAAARYHVPKFYLILYLCALEILPVLLGYKIIRDMTGM